MDGGPALNRHWIKVSCFLVVSAMLVRVSSLSPHPPLLQWWHIPRYNRHQPPSITQTIQDVRPVLVWCWAIICDSGPELKQDVFVLYATARSHDQTRRASDSSIEYTKYSTPSKNGWIVATKASWCRSNVDPMPAQCLASVAAAGLTIKQQGDMCNVAGIVAY